MNFVEHIGKRLLQDHNIPTPKGEVVTTLEAAKAAQTRLGAVVIKAQVPTGKRGKAGGIALCDTPDDAEIIAKRILDMRIDGYPTQSLLIEQQIPILSEYYLAILNDSETKSPCIIFSNKGGMDVEETAAKFPDAMRRCNFTISAGFQAQALRDALDGLDLDVPIDEIVACAANLTKAYCESDAELLEINPLVVTKDKQLLALDCKFVMDDSAIKRQSALAELGTPDKATDLELRGQQLGLKYIELDGDVGILANGAGLTMTSMDMVRHHAGNPANFLEIGGDAYTKGTEALGLVLANKKVKSLVINFCGAFARTDVMTQGILQAIDELKPDLPIAWSVHGTGDTESIAMLAERNITPYPTMDAASKAAVDAIKKESP